MKRMLPLLAPALMAASLPAVEPRHFIPPTSAPAAADGSLADYFRAETATLSANAFANSETLTQWQAQRDIQRQHLQEMLGLLPWPERTPLNASVTGKLDQDDFTVEKLSFQPVPNLYVTAALYLPRKVSGRLPAILLASGHARYITNNVSYGNKAIYQDIAAYFARNGYVCLNVDTLSLGEIRGDHLGTRDLGQWWWNSRGYTPAGVEAWTGIRALDYLCTRPEVDSTRIGMGGHSGGGAYTWTVGALDDRIKAATAMAGLTDLQSQLCDNLVDSHCDCNFFINTYRWDFPQVAALMAPRPLLIGTTDKDRLFPVPGVSRLHQSVARLYQLYDQTNNLGLVITPGPHEWNAEGQLAALRWFNRHLKGEDPLVETAAKPFFKPEALQVFATPPTDAINTNLQSTFVPLAKPLSTEQIKAQRDSLLATLHEKSFAGWPADDVPLAPKSAFTAERDGLKFSAWDFTSQHDVTLRLYFLEATSAPPTNIVVLQAFDATLWPGWLGALRSSFETELTDELRSTTNAIAPNHGALEKLKRELTQHPGVLAFCAPRGLGLDTWSGGDKRLTQIRRRFMLLGQTLDGMRAWDLRRAVQTIHFIREGDTAHVELQARGNMAVNALIAALYEPGIRRLTLKQLPPTLANGPDYLNILRTLELPQLLDLARTTAEIR